MQSKKVKNFCSGLKTEKAGIVSGLDIPKSEEFDVKFNLKLTYRETKDLKRDKNLRKLKTENKFDFLEKNSRIDFYNISLRVVRFKITEKTIETVITNLDEKDFSPKNIERNLQYTLWNRNIISRFKIFIR